MAVDADLIRREALYKSAEQSILEGGQSVTVEGISYVKADLGKILHQLNAIQAEMRRQSYGGGSNRVRFGDRG